jgi:uncharacterized protein YxjI
MHAALQQNVYLVKEHVGLFKAANNFDIYDPAGGPQSTQPVLHCREPNLGILTKLLRFTDYKRMTPFEIVITTPQGAPVVTVRRGISLLWSSVRVYDERETLLGTFKQKLFSIGGAFNVLDANDQPLCTLQGKWTGWEFRFRQGETELAMVTKKWAGLGKELFTTADNYVLSVSPQVKADAPVRGLILAAVMCIDMVLKE